MATRSCARAGICRRRASRRSNGHVRCHHTRPPPCQPPRAGQRQRACQSEHRPQHRVRPRRLLHARDAYTGYRRLAGAYLNKEDVESRLRVLRLKKAQRAA